MRVLVSTYGSRRCVEPVVGRAAPLRARGAEMRVCAPPDVAELLARVGVPVALVGLPVRHRAHGSRFRSVADVPRRAAALIAKNFDTAAAAAAGCEAQVATGVTPEGVWL